MYFADRTIDHIYIEYKQTLTPIGIGTFSAIETWDKCYSLWFDHQDTDIESVCVIDRILINGYTNMDMTESAYALYRRVHEKSCHDLLDLVLTLDDVCRLERLDSKEYNLDEHFIKLYYTSSKKTVTLSHWAFSSALDLADCMIYLEPEHKLVQAKVNMRARAVLTTENRNVIILKPNTDMSTYFTNLEPSKK